MFIFDRGQRPKVGEQDAGARGAVAGDVNIPLYVHASTGQWPVQLSEARNAVGVLQEYVRRVSRDGLVASVGVGSAKRRGALHCGNEFNTR